MSARRLILLSLLCLSLGLITTVAVAWSSALLLPPARSTFITRTITSDDGSGGIYAARSAQGATMSCVAWFPGWPIYGQPESMPLPPDPELKAAKTALVRFGEAGV